MTSTIKCEFCGALREPMMISLGENKQHQFGFVPCKCPDAEAKSLRILAKENALQEEQRNELTFRKLRKAGIPERYLAATHDKADAVAVSVMEGRGFYIAGTQGTGKTHLAMAVARLCIERGASCKVVIIPALMEAMRSRTTENRDATTGLARCRVLVLDDLGKETPTAYACERLFDIINERYNAMLPVVVTSNYTRSEIARRLTEGDVGKSIASRLCEMTRTIHIDGEDRRLNRG